MADAQKDTRFRGDATRMRHNTMAQSQIQICNANNRSDDDVFDLALQK